MSKLPPDKWIELVGRLVQKMSGVLLDTYALLHPEEVKDGKGKINAEWFAEMFADATVCLLTTITDKHRRDSSDGKTEFDMIDVFMHALMVRLSLLGYSVAIGDQMENPELHKRAVELIRAANRPPEGTLKQ